MDLPDPGIELGLLHCRQILYQLSHKGNPRTLEWVAYPFASRSSWPRDWTRASCIAGILYQIPGFIKWKKGKESEVAQSCLTLCDPMDWVHGTLHNTGVGSLSLLQGIFLTQGSKPGLAHCRWILYQLSHKGNPRTLEWAAYPFSSGSSQPRNWTGVSCTAGGFFTNWASYQGSPKSDAKPCPEWV